MKNLDFEGQCENRDSRGVVYVAFGYSYLLRALYSCLTLSKFSELPVTVVTNIKVEDSSVPGLKNVTLLHVDLPRDSNRLAKIQCNQWSPYLRTLFVDCDTQFLQSPDDGFLYLDRYDIAMRGHSSPVDSRSDYRPNLPFEPSRFSSWNSGIIFFSKSTAASEFFKSWANEFLALNQKFDQPSLVSAVWKVRKVNVLSLNYAWNSSLEDYKILAKNSKQKLIVDHYRPGLRSNIILERAETRFGGIVGEKDKFTSVQEKNDFYKSFSRWSKFLRLINWLFRKIFGQ